MSITALTTPQKELKVLTDREEVRKAFEKVMGESAGAFIASMLTAVSLSDQLKFADPHSVINSAMLAASLKLPIEQNLGQAWIIPYKTREGTKAQFQIGYKGLIQLALRSGVYKKIHAGIIYNGVTVKMNPITGEVVADGEPISEEPIGYIGYIEMKNGYSHAVYMTKQEVAAHAEKYSKSWGYESSPWTTHFNEMAKKTVLKKVLTKYGILSVEMSRAMTADTTPMAKLDTSDIDPKIVDAKAEAPRVKQSREANMEQLTGQSPERPWSPEYIREKVQGWMLDLKGAPLDENAISGKRKITAAILDKATGDKTKRYEVCNFLTGKSSTADMWEETLALMNWLGVSRFEDQPSADVMKEIAAVHTAALKAKGQLTMEGVA